MKNTAKKGLWALVLAAFFMGGALTLSLTLASCDLIDNLRGSMDSGDDTVPTYIVSFNVNGGTGTVPSTKIVTAGYSMPVPGGSGLYRYGYTFGGWNTNSSGTGINYPAQSYLTPTNNVTLFAKWNFSSGIIPNDDFDCITSLAEKVKWLQANAQRGGNYIIELWASESTGLLNLSFGSRTNITIAVRGVSINRTISLSSNGNIFYVGRGVTLVLENVTLRGRSSNTFPLVYVDGGTLIMRNGSAITNNSGSGVEVDGGVLVMNGGSIISGNTVNYAGGGGVAVKDGTFTMYGGTISGNKAYWGGGVLVQGGVFTMYGGTISGNRAEDYGGGVVVFSGSFSKNGGIITGIDATNGNQASTQWGGHAVYAHGNGGVKTRDKTAGPGVNMVYNSVSNEGWD